MLGVDHVVATRMEVVDGCYTGDIAFYAYGEHKETAIREMAAERGWDLADCYAYSDSETDIPMLSAVGHPVAINPDKPLRKHAADSGWPVRVFAKPVRASRRVPTPPGPPMAYAGALTVAALVALAWVLGRRPARSGDL
jgi:phosphoserine phosphatase